MVARHDLGERYLLWSSSYPNAGSSWPSSGLSINEQLDGVPDDERGHILAENCAEWYGLPVPELATA